jgi:hypothetical protein
MSCKTETAFNAIPHNTKDSDNEPDSAETRKAPSLRNILQQKNKMKTKQDASAGSMMETMMTSEQRLIPGAMVRGVGLLQALQDDIHRL